LAIEQLNAPYGGRLVDLLVPEPRARVIREQSNDWLSWDLTSRQLCDLELLLNGAFSPLTGYLGSEDYQRVCTDARLASGLLWPIPVTLDVPEGIARQLKNASPLALRDPEGVVLAVLHVADVWQPDLDKEGELVYGTRDELHPSIEYLKKRSHKFYVAGRIEGISLPRHYDFRRYRLTPKEARGEFSTRGWTRVVGFNTRNPMHRAHYELTRRACEEHGANLFIHPIVGMTKQGDIDYPTRVRCYEAMLSHYARDTVMLGLLNLAMRMGGPREALLHAIIRKNFGCSHFIIGRDHAGPGRDREGKHFYHAHASQQFVAQHAAEIGISLICFENMVYVEELDAYVPESQVQQKMTARRVSGTEIRKRVTSGEDIPAWMSFPDVVSCLRANETRRPRRGITIFLTGLSGAGKSTIAKITAAKIVERSGRLVTVLDGDVVRKNLSSGLGFSKEDRDTNIRRIGFVAAEITKHGGIAICAPIAPYDAVRREVREAVEEWGRFLLVFVDTPLDECERRDTKGLYARARAGRITDLTGVSDPYERPRDAELQIDGIQTSADEAADQILDLLEREGCLAGA